MQDLKLVSWKISQVFFTRACMSEAAVRMEFSSQEEYRA